MSSSQIEWAAGTDLYADLELPNTATQGDIKSAYKRLALKYHPDKQQPGQPINTAPFREVREAYEVLSNDNSRRRYGMWRFRQSQSWNAEAIQRAEAEERRRRHEEHALRTEFLEKTMARMEALAKQLGTEHAAREYARKVSQAEQRSQAAIRRRQKEADRMARSRLQKQKEVEGQNLAQEQRPSSQARESIPITDG